MNRSNLEPVYVPLKIAFGVVPFLAGLDKFFNLLADWEGYLSPAIAELLPFGAGAFLAIVGVVEMAVGIAILTRFTRIGAYVASAWLVLIAGNLLFAGVLDVAVRDLVLAVAAYGLARVAELREAPQSAWNGRTTKEVLDAPARG